MSPPADQSADATQRIREALAAEPWSTLADLITDTGLRRADIEAVLDAEVFRRP